MLTAETILSSLVVTCSRFGVLLRVNVINTSIRDKSQGLASYKEDLKDLVWTAHQNLLKKVLQIAAC